MAKRRRVSSDGLQLFNMAIMEAPKYSKIKQILSCIFGSEYDDRLDEMVNQCREASTQLYGYTNFKDVNTNKLINNSMYNIIHAVLMKDGTLGNKVDVRRNYQYFMDVAEKACNEEDHNTAILIRASLMHYSIQLLKLKQRKKDKELLTKFDKMYGTFRNCYKEHLAHAMNTMDNHMWIPSLMVLNMHKERHKAYATIGNCRLRYDELEIQARIGMNAMYNYYPGEKMPLYEQPMIGDNTALILLAQHVKK